MISNKITFLVISYFHQYRFPLKSQTLLEKWEHAVQRVRNDGTEWRATRHRAISAATTLKDGIIVYFHSSKGACRLKNNAVPSVFQLFTPPQGYGMTEEARNRLEMPEQCSTPKRYT